LAIRKTQPSNPTNGWNQRPAMWNSHT
jgi:hypothetical protein